MLFGGGPGALAPGHSSSSPATSNNHILNPGQLDSPKRTIHMLLVYIARPRQNFHMEPYVVERLLAKIWYWQRPTVK